MIQRHVPPPAPGRPQRAPARLARVLLRLPLFHKLCLSSGVVTAVAGGAVLGAAAWLTGGVAGDVVAPLVVFAVLMVVGGAGLNALLVRIALSPLERLEAVAERVAGGLLNARVDLSPLADKSMESITRAFNQMLDSLEASRQRERELAIRVLDAEERERRRLARELYGGAAQSLAGVLVRLQVAARRSSPDADILAEVRDEVARSLGEIREVARRLRPPELDDLGVGAALEVHARKLTETWGVPVTFEGRVPESCLDDGVRVALLRIVQQATSNAVVHGRGTSVEVTFRSTPVGLQVEVRDDGRGFDAAAAIAAPEGNLGLLGMRERAGYAGGSLRIESSPGGGTIVGVVMPWRRETWLHDTAPGQARRARHA